MSPLAVFRHSVDLAMNHLHRHAALSRKPLKKTISKLPKKLLFLMMATHVADEAVVVVEAAVVAEVIVTEIAAVKPLLEPMCLPLVVRQEIWMTFWMTKSARMRKQISQTSVSW